MTRTEGEVFGCQSVGQAQRGRIAYITRISGCVWGWQEAANDEQWLVQRHSSVDHYRLT